MCAMGLWRSVASFLAAPFQGSPRVTADSSESAPRPIDQVILDMANRSGKVSRSLALSVPAVLRGRNMLCSIATLPLDELNKSNVQQASWLDQIDPDVPNVVTLAQTIEDLLFDGLSWWEIIATDAAGFPTSARHLDVGTVSIDPPQGRSPAPLPSGLDPRAGIVYVDGKPRSGAQIKRFDSPNPGILNAAGKVIRRAVLFDAAASLYATDPRPLDFFVPAPDADAPEDEEVQDILDQWAEARRSRSTGYVPASLKYETVDAPNPQQLQLVELARQAALELANALGVDPEDLGISTTSRTYTNAIDRRRDRINDVLSPYMSAITQRLTMGDMTRRGRSVVFDLDDYMRANPTERWAVYKTAEELGVMDAQDIQREERMPEKVIKKAAPPAPAESIDPDKITVPSDASSLARYGFTAPVGQTWTADMEHVSARFTVSTAKRTITGLALPYGVEGSKYGMRFAFLAGSIRWNKSAVNRVKLLRDHDPRQAIGFAVRLWETPDGLMGEFKVARGQAGDDALALAAEGVLDGLSVGVDFDEAVDTRVASDDSGLILIMRADLRETSLTPMPLFDDARVTKVAASRTNLEGTAMPCTTCGQVHAAGVTCTAPPTNAPTSSPPAAPAGMQLSADQLALLLSQPGALQSLVSAQQAAAQPTPPAGALTLSADQVRGLISNGGLGVLLGVPRLTPAPSAAPAETPAVVNPAGRTGALSASVNEPLPYRFDSEGNLTMGATYDFSRDLVAGSKGDGEALQRASAFVQSQAWRFTLARGGPGRIEADVDMADAAGLNPNRNRPDMYVDQKTYTYPIWDAISKGTLADMTPFVLPKFNTSSGLTAAHVEGVEPTPGAVTATSQTITPTAISGKAEITREAWDQGGNPQLSGIIWRQMERSWYEGLEVAAVALLDAATPTGITLTTAAVDDVLVGQLESAIASLQFIRGGMRMRDFFGQVDLYKALAAAVDADGRKLLPRLGPVNASGQTSDLFADLDVAGLRLRPGWALAATGTVAASSYLFDRMDVHGWASAPQRLEFQYRVAYVDIGIWGYKATAITDITGVREVIYDPA